MDTLQTRFASTNSCRGARRHGAWRIVCMAIVGVSLAADSVLAAQPAAEAVPTLAPEYRDAGGYAVPIAGVMAQAKPPATIENAEPIATPTPAVLPVVPTPPVQPIGPGATSAADDPINYATRKRPAMELVNEASRALARRRASTAVRLCTQAIAIDPDGAQEYQRVRAQAYLMLRRFDLAVGDVRPLQVTVGPTVANLKAGKTIVGAVTNRSTVLVDEVRGDWLRVASVDGHPFNFGWLHTRDVLTGWVPIVETTPAAVRVYPPYYYRRPVVTRGDVIPWVPPIARKYIPAW